MKEDTRKDMTLGESYGGDYDEFLFDYTCWHEFYITYKGVDYAVTTACKKKGKGQLRTVVREDQDVVCYTAPEGEELAMLDMPIIDGRPLKEMMWDAILNAVY